MLEFAFVAPLFLMLVFGIVTYGSYFSESESLTNAVSAAARLAAVNPTAWSNASSAPPGTIQGILQSESGMASVTNDDAHIQISYFALGASPTSPPCYTYSVYATAPPPGFGTTCGVAGGLIRVWVSAPLNVSSPLPLPITSVNASVILTEEITAP